MKIVVVPVWLTKVLECNDLPMSSLLDIEALSPYLSKKDLRDYASLPYGVSDYLQQRLGLTLNVQHAGADDMPGPNLHVPSIGDQTDIMDRIGKLLGGNETINQRLIGHHMTEGLRVDFTVDVFTTHDSEDVVGLFARLSDDNESDPKEVDLRLLEDLAGILYARNHGLRDLAADGILEAYINHVG